MITFQRVILRYTLFRAFNIWERRIMIKDDNKMMKRGFTGYTIYLEKIPSFGGRRLGMTYGNVSRQQTLNCFGRSAGGIRIKR